MKENLELTSSSFVSKPEENQSAALWRLEGKYNQLLEKYNKLLEMVIRAINANKLHDLHQEMAQMLEK